MLKFASLACCCKCEALELGTVVNSVHMAVNRCLGVLGVPLYFAPLCGDREVDLCVVRSWRSDLESKSFGNSFKSRNQEGRVAVDRVVGILELAACCLFCDNVCIFGSVGIIYALCCYAESLFHSVELFCCEELGVSVLSERILIKV